MAPHPDLDAEQAYIDHAYECLADARESALRLRRMTAIGRGGTFQNRYESDVVEDTIRARLASLELGDAALVFGRIDELEGDRYYIGRIAVADQHQEPVVVDWRAPVAEPFYRATGRSTMGLTRRRHFAIRGRHLLDIEDEVFGEGGGENEMQLIGKGALIAALERRRSGYLGDIVATIQTEQDEIIRSELGGVLVVQGGPGTGKTVVALHRAAYLLYTHRFPLEGQGVLVIGPNRIFLRYIERVLPSLGEAGVELATLGDLVPEPIVDGAEPTLTAEVKGDLRMAKVLANAVHDRERPLREDLVVGFGLTNLRLSAEGSRRIVSAVRRRVRHHNAGRRIVEALVWEALASSHPEHPEPGLVRDRVRHDHDVRAALEWMWPVLTPSDLLHDLFGSRALTRLAGRNVLSEREQASLYRERTEVGGVRPWAPADVSLLDEARALLGPRPRAPEGEEDIRTYGHIVVDEAQDLSPMQLRMLSRRSLGGSMTVVGDIAQATGPWAPSSWDEVLRLLPARKPPRVRELSIGYRTPAAVMELAGRVLAVAAPELQLPRSVREGDSPPVVSRVEPGTLAAAVAAAADAERRAVGDGNVAVVAPVSLVDELGEALSAAGVAHGEATRVGLDAQVTLVPIRLVKGLELDSVIVVEPARIVEEEAQGLRALYVALTRSTQRLTVLHEDDLPRPLVDTPAPRPGRDAGGWAADQDASATS